MKCYPFWRKKSGDISRRSMARSSSSLLSLESHHAAPFFTLKEEALVHNNFAATAPSTGWCPTISTLRSARGQFAALSSACAEQFGAMAGSVMKCLVSASAFCYARLAGLTRMRVCCGSRLRKKSAMRSACFKPLSLKGRSLSGRLSTASACRHRISSTIFSLQNITIHFKSYTVYTVFSIILKKGDYYVKHISQT